MSDNRPIVYVEGDVLVFRASAIGRPLRCLTLAAIGEEPRPSPEYLLAAAEAGNEAEITVKQMLVDMGYRLDADEDQYEVEHSEVVQLADRKLWVKVRGHLDSLSCVSPTTGEDRMLEVKSMSQNVWDSWKLHRFHAFPEYAHQLSVYMHATGKRALYAVINRDTGELELIEIDTPPIEIDAIANKMRIVAILAESEQLPDCEGAKYECAYAWRCNRKRKEVEIESALARLVRDYLEVDARRKEIDAERERLRSLIAKQVEGVDKAQVPGATVSWRKPSRRLNTKAVAATLEQFGSDIELFYEVPANEKDSLVITPSKAKRKREE